MIPSSTEPSANHLDFTAYPRYKDWNHTDALSKRENASLRDP
jgi:hypothetical protein